VIISGRKKICVEYTKAGLNVFSYRFDTPLVSKLETTCNRISGCLSVLEVQTSFQGNAAVTAGAQHWSMWYSASVGPSVSLLLPSSL